METHSPSDKEKALGSENGYVSLQKPETNHQYFSPGKSATIDRTTHCQPLRHEIVTNDSGIHNLTRLFFIDFNTNPFAQAEWDTWPIVFSEV